MFIGFTILTFLSRGMYVSLVLLPFFFSPFHSVFLEFLTVMYLVLYCRWYQIKITVRWEDSENISYGIPARVVQYEGNVSKLFTP